MFIGGVSDTGQQFFPGVADTVEQPQPSRILECSFNGATVVHSPDYRALFLFNYQLAFFYVLFPPLSLQCVGVYWE
jgi:hypothetical protein